MRGVSEVPVYILLVFLTKMLLAQELFHYLTQLHKNSAYLVTDMHPIAEDRYL